MSRNILTNPVSGLSGNEIYCLNKIGYTPGQLCIGNSVMAIGAVTSLTATISNLAGGEVTQITQIIHEARERALDRMLNEAKDSGSSGITTIKFDVIQHDGQIEFLAIGSSVNGKEQQDGMFSSAASGQEVYSQIDAGFTPKSFVFGNIAYSIGIGGGILGSINRLARGEVPQFTAAFDQTRHEVLRRLKEEAITKKANAIVDINTEILPIFGTQEMLMLGTASENPLLKEYYHDPVTSSLDSTELWSLINMGYMPIKLVLGVSVYSLGLGGMIKTMFQKLIRGEIKTATLLLHEARDKAIERIHKDAMLCGADKVVGVKIKIYQLGGGLVECLVIGTAIKKVEGAHTKSDTLPPQAIATSRDLFSDNAKSFGTSIKNTGSSGSTLLTPFSIISSIIFVAIAGTLILSDIFAKGVGH